jgi:amino acid adenylation domain-containing protein
LPDLVTAQAELRPGAVALVMNGARLTYEALEEASNRLARALGEVGCRRGDRVCLFVPKCPEAIVGMLGVAKAGAIYVPVDVTGPALRAARIVASAEPACVLVTEPALALAREALSAARLPAPVRMGRLDRVGAGDARCDFDGTDVERLDGARPSAGEGPIEAAHILFTSGSTGEPKGVVVTHDSVLAFLRWATAHFGLSAADRTSGHSPLHFDLSTFDVYGTFAAGAQLYPVPPELNLVPHKLAAFIRDHELTQWFSVPSVLAYLAGYDVVRSGDFPALTRLLWCGEVLPTPVLIHWMRRLPHVTFTNLYGPTEATIASSHYTVPRCPDDARLSIPIGTPCAGEELLVLDDALQPVARGEIGQLHIGGVGLSPGYWRDPEKTREAFPAVRAAGRLYRTGDLAKVGEDGLVYFLGRTDSQIKIRGHRVELGEVESAARASRSIRECAVVAALAAGFEGVQICCAYVPAEGARPDAASLRRELARLLPGYMLPGRWLELDALPKNQNGKIDRPGLRRCFEEQSGHEAP